MSIITDLGYDSYLVATEGAMLTDKQIESADRAACMFDIIKTDNISRDIVQLMSDPYFVFWSCKHLLGLNLSPIHALVLTELWTRPFPMLIASRGFSKTFGLAVLALLKMRLEPGTKIVGIGSSFRQSKLIWEYMCTIYEKADVLRSTCNSGTDGPKRDTDRCTFRIGDSVSTFIPIGAHGDKIRGLRANCVMSDEFSSIPIDVYETVIVGFGAVSKDPMQNAILAARRLKMIERNEWSDDLEKNFGTNTINQQIITGTADYDFGHFSKYHRNYHAIISCKGDPEKYSRITGREYEGNIKSENYSIMRIPRELIPHGFMDSDTIDRAKATMNSSNYGREYGAIFPKDSMGFFRRTLIESCIAKHNKPININGEEVSFVGDIKGQSDRQYVFGLDPASEVDNLSVVILELHKDHSRVVYCWTINKKRFQKKIKAGILEQHDYFQYCAQKIRELMAVFPCVRIMMDAQGGGFTFKEVFANPPEGQTPIYEVVDKTKKKPTDNKAGLHIIEMCQFANAQWCSEANHGLKYDMENKFLLFPEYDVIELAASVEADNARLVAQGLPIDDDRMGLYDSREDCLLEIEELKDELTTITHTITPGGNRERWDTPEVKVDGGKKGRMKKDRYSSLVMANMGARQIERTQASAPDYVVFGGVSGQMDKISNKGNMYSGPDWYRKGGAYRRSGRNGV